MTEYTQTAPDLLDGAGVASGLRRWVPLGATIAENWRREGRIMGVRRETGMAYPACQFDEAGLPLATMRQVILALRPRMDAEAMLDWLHAPCEMLEGRAPREVLHEDPAVVRRAAMLAGSTGHPAAA